MTAHEIRARIWCGAACAIAQVAATAAGMVPWWALPLTLALTVAVSRPNGPVDPRRAILTRNAGVASVALFSTIIAVRTISRGREGIIDPTATLRSLSEALVVLSLIMAPQARTPREHRVWLTVTTGVLVAAAAGAKNVSTGAMLVVAWVVALIAIAKVQTTAAYANGAVSAQVVGVPRRDGPRMFRQLDQLGPVASTLIAGAIVFFLLPTGLGGGDLARALVSHVQQANLALADRQQVGVDTQGFGDLSLLVRGSLPDTPLLRVSNDAPPLWRGTFFRTYTGTSWVNPSGAPAAVDGPSAAVPKIADDPPPKGGTTRRDAVSIEPGAAGGLIWSPGVPTHLKASGNQVRKIVRGPANVRVFENPAAPLTSYTVTSVVAPTGPSILEAASGDDPADAVWTALPAEVPTEVSDLAHRITAGAGNRYQQVTAIEKYLLANETYTLNAPIAPRGVDAVDDFLFRTHQGFCELFASAETVMLRTLGVPARLVSGLAYGVKEGSSRLYTEQNAHAWVEVYYPGIGWSPVDPTAGAQLADTAGSGESLFSRAFNAAASALPGGRLSLAVLGAAVLVLVGWIVRSMMGGVGLPWPGRRRLAGTPPGPVLAAYLRVTRDRHGPPPRALAETPRQYLQRVGGETPGMGTAVLALEQELYGEGPPDDASVHTAVDALESLVRS
ncbi:MAG TPA: transglutaminase domain-containing protein [Mycobacteriales bacterium]|jgi:transglutaminase-like putative cysteine protease|nr:transglutaminase domain-containing protein [Mycobacteriales bacterium]